MPALLLALSLAAAPAPQERALDVAVYENTEFGVALPRPFADWVFEPATSRGTTTVIFHPRESSLREQLWGALVLTTFNRDVPLGQVADQRVMSSWQPTLGPSFGLLTRDSISVLGLPAIHVVMTGSINLAVLDVEEYLIARGGDLILLQFRYPRGLPRDSIAAGYQRSFDGLRILGAPGTPAAGVTPATPAAAPAGPQPAPVVSAREVWRALGDSPWRPVAYDALVRLTNPARLDITVRVDVLNAGNRALDSLALWLWPRATADSVRFSGGRAARAAGPRIVAAAPLPVGAGDYASVTIYYHVNQAPSPVFEHWLPLVAPLTDSLGRARRAARPRRTLRFDVPPGLAAVSSGRLISDGLSAGRRRMTWAVDAAGPTTPAFAVGAWRPVARREGRLSARLWADANADSSGLDSLWSEAARAFRFLSRVFGPLPESELSLVLVSEARTAGVPGLVVVGAPGSNVAGGDALVRELARSWWGGRSMPHGPGSSWLYESFPAWSALAARAQLGGDSLRQRLVRDVESRWREMAAAHDPPLEGLPMDDAVSRALLLTKGVAAIEAARRAVGDSRFRAALRELFAAHHGDFLTTSDLLALLGDDGREVLRPYLQGR
jgi:hypothetical protein